MARSLVVLACLLASANAFTVAPAHVRPKSSARTPPPQARVVEDLGIGLFAIPLVAFGLPVMANMLAETLARRPSETSDKYNEERPSPFAQILGGMEGKTSDLGTIMGGGEGGPSEFDIIGKTIGDIKGIFTGEKVSDFDLGPQEPVEPAIAAIEEEPKKTDDAVAAIEEEPKKTDDGEPKA